MGIFKSIGDIANAINSTKEVVSSASELVKTTKEIKKDSVSEKTAESSEGIYPEKIEKLIKFILMDGEFGEDEIDTLTKAAIKEGLDPDEVIFVTKKRLKRTSKAVAPKLSPAQKLAADLAEIDEKFDNAIHQIRIGDSSGASALLDAFTGGGVGLAVSIGKSIFGQSDDDKIEELEEARYAQRERIISSTIIPNDVHQVQELLEFVYQNVNNQVETAWDNLHVSVYNKAIMLAGNDEVKLQYLASYIPESLKPKKKKRFGLF